MGRTFHRVGPINRPTRRDVPDTANEPERRPRSTERGITVEIGGHLTRVGRDTPENWQSEILQLVWQVAGLAFLRHMGSPQSAEGSGRTEEKVDAIPRAVRPEEAERIIADLDARFDRT